MSKTTEKMRSYFGWAANIGPHFGVFVGIALSIALGYMLVSGGNNEPRGQTPQLVLPSVEQRDPRDVARPHLMWAATKCLSGVEEPLDQVRAVFANARSQSRMFAEEALGWDSKLTIVSDYFQQTNRHSEFLRQKFESLVISEEELLSTVEQGISQFQQATVSIEGEMLVRLRSDAGDFKYSPLTVVSDTAAIQSLFQQAISQSGSAAGIDLQAAVGREVASYILGEIATQVGVQLGVSSGILSAGALSGWSNFGISIIVGFAVDQMITAAYDAYADPKGQLASQINAQLDEMERLIVDGSEDEPGLRTRLQQFTRERSALRESAVLQLLTSKDGGAL